MTNPTIMQLAFIDAQRKEQTKVETQVQTEVAGKVSNAQRIYEFLQDKGGQLPVHVIANKLGMEKQVVSVSLFQLKKVGYVDGIPTLNGYMEYKAGDAVYGTLKRGRKAATKNYRAAQVVTPQAKSEPRMIALPAPNGVKITVQTDDGPLVMSVKQAKAVYKELSALFGQTEVRYDD